MFRLLLQKLSDPGLPCLSRPFWQATSVCNFRTFTILEKTCLTFSYKFLAHLMGQHRTNFNALAFVMQGLIE